MSPIRNGTTRAALHAMGRLVGKGVPHLGWRPVRATDDQGVAAWVIQALEPSLRAVFLNDTDPSLRELVAQNINGFPGHRLGWDGRKERQADAWKPTPATAKQRSVQRP